MKKFSVVIPVYNVEKYLDECVKSVLSQTFTDYEVLLVDDGSTDASGDMCDGYALSDDRIKVIHKQNGGLSSARNAGIKEASGEYLLFLDSDDYWASGEMLEELNDEAEKTSADVIVCNYLKLFEKDGKIENKKFGDVVLKGDKTEDVKTLLKYALYGSSACFKCVKLSLIIRNGVYFEDGKLSEDVEWSARILIFAKRFGCVNKGFYVYRQRVKSISHTISERNLDDLQKAIGKSLHYAKEYSLEEPFLSVYYAYIAYQYATLCFCVNLLPTKAQRGNRIKAIKPYKRILNYGLAKKVRLLNFIRRVIGLKSAIRFAYSIRNKNG